MVITTNSSIVVVIVIVGVVVGIPGGDLRVPDVRRERPGGHYRDEPRVAGRRAGAGRGAELAVRAESAPQHGREGVGHGGAGAVGALAPTPASERGSCCGWW